MIDISKNIDIIDDRDKYFRKLEDNLYHAICFYDGITDVECPNNKNGFCSMGCIDYPRAFYHDFDGRNAWKCPCG
jgi:hypothetical protein